MKSVNSIDVRKIKKRYMWLKTEIDRHNRLYYVENRAEISDFEYDCLKAEFDDICKRHSDFDSDDKVGSDLGDNVKVLEHLSPMLSLSNTYSMDELFAFDNRLIGIFGKNDLEYLIEPKVDGVAVNLIYEMGLLKVGLTRGDGLVGEVITDNVNRINDIPKELSGNCPKLLEVRGEVYLTNEQFNLLNAQQEALGLEQYANARNLASGSIKLLDSEEVSRRNLSFVAHGIGKVSDSDLFKHQSDVSKLLEAYGFKSFNVSRLAVGAKEVWNILGNWQKICSQLDYNTDGAVIKLNDRQLHSELGSTAKAPRWAIAYKFEPDSAETTVKNIIFQVGRTGVITPVSVLEPTLLAGSTITRATLHNFNDLAKKDVRIGDRVLIQKAGEVIPAISKVFVEKRVGTELPITFPSKCPECGAQVTKINGEAFIRCASSACPPQIRLKIVHFSSKTAMDISGMGPKVVDKLVSNDFIKNITDVFLLKQYRNELINLDRFSDKLIDNLLAEIEKSKKNPFWRLIHGIGIPNVGAEMSKNIAKEYNSLDKLISAKFEDLVKIDLVGEVIADGILKFFENIKNLEIANFFIKNEICFSPQNLEKATVNKKFANKKFVITGTLHSMSRNEAKTAIEALDGNVSSKVSNSTYALIAGENTGSKYLDAKKYNVEIWDEQKFLSEINR